MRARRQLGEAGGAGSGTGTGSEIMQRIAAPMVGGMVSSTVLLLLVIPAIFVGWKYKILQNEK